MHVYRVNWKWLGGGESMGWVGVGLGNSIERFSILMRLFINLLQFYIGYEYILL